MNRPAWQLVGLASCRHFRYSKVRIETDYMIRTGLLNDHETLKILPEVEQLMRLFNAITEKMKVKLKG